MSEQTMPRLPSEGDGDRMAAALAAGRARWPEVHLSARDLMLHLHRNRVSPMTLESRGADLFLAAACARGDPAALQAFESEYLTRVPLYLGRFNVPDALLDELRQQLRMKLLLGPPPRIAAYAGAGPLGAWVRMATVRIALDLLETVAREPQALDQHELAAEIAAQPAPEDRLAAHAHRPTVQAALEAALKALPDRDRALLRFHFIEGLGVEAIGRIYRVHRATAARWLVDIRQRVVKDVEQRIAVDLGTSPSEFRSLVEAVRDELRASLSRILGA